MFKHQTDNNKQNVITKDEKKRQEEHKSSARSSSWCGAIVQRGTRKVSSDAAAEKTLAELMDSTLKTRDLRWQTERNGAQTFSVTEKMLRKWLRWGASTESTGGNAWTQSKITNLIHYSTPNGAGLLQADR